MKNCENGIEFPYTPHPVSSLHLSPRINRYTLQQSTFQSPARIKLSHFLQLETRSWAPGYNSKLAGLFPGSHLVQVHFLLTNLCMLVQVNMSAWSYLGKQPVLAVIQQFLCRRNFKSNLPWSAWAPASHYVWTFNRKNSPILSSYYACQGLDCASAPHHSWDPVLTRPYFPAL